MAASQSLLSIVELGGYPDFTDVYQRYGYEVSVANSMRKAMKLLKKLQPDVIVAEFNFQSDFRDRTSSLESLMASVAQFEKAAKVIVFYEAEQRTQLERLLAVFGVHATLAFPVTEAQLATTLAQIQES